MTKFNFKSKICTTSDILELLHIDLCGPIGVKRNYGDQYFIPFVDGQSIMMIVMFLNVKFHSFSLFKWYLSRVEKETGKSLKFLRSNMGGEFISHEINTF